MGPAAFPCADPSLTDPCSDPCRLRPLLLGGSPPPAPCPASRAGLESGKAAAGRDGSELSPPPALPLRGNLGWVPRRRRPLALAVGPCHSSLPGRDPGARVSGLRGAGRHGCLSPHQSWLLPWFCLQSLINSLKKGPELLKWFPTCPRPQRRRPAQPPTPPAGGSPRAPRTPSSPCELVCGLAPRWQVTCLPPSRHRPLLPSPAPLSPQSCTAVSMEMPLCLLPGLPRVRTASLRRWDSCSQRPLTARPHSHHRFPSTSCRRAGGRARLGPVVPLGLAPEQTRGLSLLQLLSSLSSEPGPRRRTAHSAGLGSQGCGRAAQTTGQWALAPGWLLWDCTPLQPRVLPSRSAHLGRGARVGSLC